MITGLYKTPLERFENTVINTSMIIQVGMVLLKVAGLTSVSWLVVALPTISLVGFILSTILALYIFNQLMRLKDTVDLLRYQKQQQNNQKQHQQKK